MEINAAPNKVLLLCLKSMVGAIPTKAPRHRNMSFYYVQHNDNKEWESLTYGLKEREKLWNKKMFKT